MSDSIKSEIIDKFTIMTADKGYSYEQRKQLSDTLWIILNDYTISEKHRELVVFSDLNARLVKRFIANKMLEGCSQRTLTYYYQEIIRFLRWLQKTATDTEIGDIKTYLALGMTGGITKNKWSLASGDNIRRILSSFFGWMHEEALISKNPASRVKKIRQPKSLRRAFTYAEMELLRMECDNVRDRAIIEFLLSTGCRVGELVNAKLSDLKLGEGILTVWGKGNKERTVYINDVSKVWLEKYLATRTDNIDYIFLARNRPYRKLEIPGVEIMIRDLGRKANVKSYPHKFRRTAATWAHKRGMKLEEIKMMLGHEDVSTTLIYTEVDQRDIQIAHERYLGG